MVRGRWVPPPTEGKGKRGDWREANRSRQLQTGMHPGGMPTPPPPPRQTNTAAWWIFMNGEGRLAPPTARRAAEIEFEGCATSPPSS